MAQEGYKCYEYISVSVNDNDVYLTTDRYKNLGYTLEAERKGILNTKLVFKRDNSIKNKEQLNNLQVRIEDGASKITELEQGKKKSARIFSCIFGSVSALVFGGGLSLCMLAFEPLIIWCVIAGVSISIAGGAAAAVTYPIYKRLVKKATVKADPLIKRKSEELNELCLKAYNIAVNA